jgi:hypothetical protein
LTLIVPHADRGAGSREPGHVQGENQWRSRSCNTINGYSMTKVQLGRYIQSSENTHACLSSAMQLVILIVGVRPCLGGRVVALVSAGRSSAHMGLCYSTFCSFSFPHLHYSIPHLSSLPPDFRLLTPSSFHPILQHRRHPFRHPIRNIIVHASHS